jgi:hypothetical protein
LSFLILTWTYPDDPKNGNGFALFEIRALNTEIEFEIEGTSVRLRKARGKRRRGQSIIAHLKEKATQPMTTDDILALTRGVLGAEQKATLRSGQWVTQCGTAAICRLKTRRRRPRRHRGTPPKTQVQSRLSHFSKTFAKLGMRLAYRHRETRVSPGKGCEMNEVTPGLKIPKTAIHAFLRSAKERRTKCDVIRRVTC